MLFGHSKYRKQTDWFLQKKYGISLERFEQILNDQGGGCAICGAKTPAESDRRLDVDHDHATGKVRGLLCNNCNRGIGHFHDDISKLKKAIEYLERSDDGNHI